MKTRIFFFACIPVFSLLFCGFQEKDNDKISPESQDCIDCHNSITPGIVADWQSSLHSRTTPNESRQKPELERRTSTASINQKLVDVVVGCYECHALNTGQHKDNFEHFGYSINIVVSPNDCATCHEIEVAEYHKSKKAYAVDILRKNSMYSALVGTYTNLKSCENGIIVEQTGPLSPRNESCFACHGTEVTVIGKRTVDTEFGLAEFPVLSNWPNMGVGRINPDGSLGSCTSCHPRHSFSIEIARKPSTCGQCHLEPDAPAYNVYKESKHGTIYEYTEMKTNFSAVPWVVGKDFTAPTCATCHNSLITNPEGTVIAKRTHDFGERLWVRIFGLPYATNQPIGPKTWEITNKDGQPLPVTFNNEPASDFLISDNEVIKRKDLMGQICKTCHGSTWVDQHFMNLDSAIITTNQMTLAATNLLKFAWEKNLEDPENPFNEPIEQMWVREWLFYANSIRYAAAMSGPDYAGFKNGWFELSNNLYRMQAKIAESKKKK